MLLLILSRERKRACRRIVAANPLFHQPIRTNIEHKPPGAGCQGPHSRLILGMEFRSAPGPGRTSFKTKAYRRANHMANGLSLTS